MECDRRYTISQPLNLFSQSVFREGQLDEPAALLRVYTRHKALAVSPSRCSPTGSAQLHPRQKPALCNRCCQSSPSAGLLISIFEGGLSPVLAESRREGASDPLEPELQDVVSHPACMLGTELGHGGRLRATSQQ